MSLFTASLNSGSNANCYYTGNHTDAILVDAGLSCRETERRMRQLGLSMDKIRALFITHEHADHISGLPGLAKKYRWPVYITADTLKNAGIPLETDLVRPFSHNKPIRIGSLSVTPFRKHHDAADPHSFMVSHAETRIGIITDIGYACKQVIKYFGQCHAVYLESNYCEKMLEEGNYPWPLKKRIRGDEGHLSNDQALELFRHYRSPELQLLILSHLSKNNNDPRLVEKIFAPHSGDVRIVVASRYEASAIFEVKGGTTVTPARPNRKLKRAPANENQLSLF